MSIRDIYYPYVGWENHVAGHRCALGVWVDGIFSWLGSRDWKREIAYEHETLVTNCSLSHEGLGIELEVSDAVHFQSDILMRKVVVKNLLPHEREVRVFFTQDLVIDGSEVGDTALYDPTIEALYHYKRNRYFLINGRARGKGLFQYAIGTKRFRGAEGTWRDAEDGTLEGNPIAEGSVDSVMSFRFPLPAGGKENLYYWMAVGCSFNEVRKTNQHVLQETPEKLIVKIRDYWRTWVNKHHRDFGDLSAPVIALYKYSLLLVRTQTDRNGAILAANDSDILREARDHYSYVWPRDGALVAYALDRAGYRELTAPFYTFCCRSLSEGGFLLHKYNPDGSLGSSWHPWVVNGKLQLPIQEDETALVLFALWNHYLCHKDFEFIQLLYKPLIRKAANFLAGYRELSTGLPLESYDLWEERRGIFTFTAAAVYAGLVAAARFARLFGDDYLIDRYLKAAEEVKAGIEKYLYHEESGRFLRGFYYDQDGARLYDFTLESSLFSIFALEVLPPDDPRVERTMKAVAEGLWVKTKIGGIARYTGDYYFRNSEDFNVVPGNPWVISTLWLAQWHIAHARDFQELDEAKKLLEWVVEHALPARVLPEQLHPFSGQPLSVAPLTWSHATFIATVLDYSEKRKYLMERS